MMTNQAESRIDNDLPHGIGNPARNALAVAGIDRLDQLTAVSAADILRLHGVGPKAVSVLRQALAARGQAFKDEPAPQPGD